MLYIMVLVIDTHNGLDFTSSSSPVTSTVTIGKGEAMIATRPSENCTGYAWNLSRAGTTAALLVTLPSNYYHKIQKNTPYLHSAQTLVCSVKPGIGDCGVGGTKGCLISATTITHHTCSTVDVK